MPKCQFLFSTVFGFRNPTQEIFSELDDSKAEVPIFMRRRRSPKESRRGATGWPDMAEARAHPWPRLGCVWAHQGPVDSASSPIYSPSQENPRYPSHIPRKVPTPPSTPNPSREGSEDLPGTLPEGEIIAGGLYITMPASRSEERRVGKEC